MSKAYQVMIGMQVWHKYSTQFPQNADNVCATEVTIQLAEGVLSTVEQHTVILTVNTAQTHLKTGVTPS